jgi:hypothetical protein
VFSEIHDYARVDGPGDRETPEAAAGRYLAREYPRLSVRDFTLAADSRAATDWEKRAVVFSYDDPEAGELMLLVEASGNSWAVANVEGCYDLHKKETSKR